MLPVFQNFKMSLVYLICENLPSTSVIAGRIMECYNKLKRPLKQGFGHALQNFARYIRNMSQAELLHNLETEKQFKYAPKTGAVWSMTEKCFHSISVEQASAAAAARVAARAANAARVADANTAAIIARRVTNARNATIAAGLRARARRLARAPLPPPVASQQRMRERLLRREAGRMNSSFSSDLSRSRHGNDSRRSDVIDLCSSSSGSSKSSNSSIDSRTSEANAGESSHRNVRNSSNAPNSSDKEDEDGDESSDSYTSQTSSSTEDSVIDLVSSSSDDHEVIDLSYLSSPICTSEESSNSDEGNSEVQFLEVRRAPLNANSPFDSSDSSDSSGNNTNYSSSDDSIDGFPAEQFLRIHTISQDSESE